MAKFKVGELVRIRQWDEMEKEFGIDADGDIKIDVGFVSSMKPLCGKNAEIVSLEKDGRVDLNLFNCDKSTQKWQYSTDMIEKV